MAQTDDLGSYPYVCPGCYTVGGGKCAPGCIDAAIEAKREERELYGSDDDEEDRPDCAIAMNAD